MSIMDSSKFSFDDVDNFVGCAKNVILFIGDGLDVTTTTASRIYAGQRRGDSGEEYKLNYEQFPNVGLSKVSIPDILLFI